MSAFAGETKNTSTFTNEANVNVNPPTKYGVSKFGTGKYGKSHIQDLQTYTKDTKNTSTFSNETLN